jgi:hypothetical protein
VTATVAFSASRDHLERFDVRVLRVRDGVEIDRPHLALARADIRPGPECGERFRQIFASRYLVPDHEVAAAIALALSRAGVDPGDDAGGIVPGARKRLMRQNDGQQVGCAR